MKYRTSINNSDLLRKRIIAILFSDLAIKLLYRRRLFPINEVEKLELEIIKLFYMSEDALDKYYRELRNA